MTKEELNKLVVSVLDRYEYCPTAREIYDDIRCIKSLNNEVRGFRSFVKLINTNREIMHVEQKGKIMIYSVKS